MLRGTPRVLALALVAVTLAAAPLAGPAAAKDVVVVYTAIENEQITEYMKAINKSLPNIELKILRFSTGDISARFMAEKDNMQADVIWGVAATNQLIFKNAGLLAPYAPKGLERIQPLFRDKANPPAWVGIDIFMSAFCFNTEVAKKHNLPAPTSWADLAKPVYKGQVVMPNPASSGTGYLSVASILQRMGETEGWKYLDAVHPNMAEYTKSGSKPCKDAAAGERAIGVSFEYVALEMKKKGAPVVMVLPKEGSGYEMEANSLTRKGAKNPAAKQFLDWAITNEAMGLYAKYFAAVGVAGFPVPEGLPKDISKVVYPNDFDWSAKNRDRILAEWQKRYAK
ncbi:MAG: putative 2-aminoethylphosphonate ABC transporter substrate-binding protein [Candidatus Rokubacteria bacterium]|nr:putative 2-aminoethylphosphonate ABC transporter substrate-binding protein [Candidatus Rokubacteria bacterium]MBI3104699.1 putative 2-aminoethylphosphonate ABC transporter substrate-binding protein [Candidatus Rokubacteria bacterium]